MCTVSIGYNNLILQSVKLNLGDYVMLEIECLKCFMVHEKIRMVVYIVYHSLLAVFPWTMLFKPSNIKKKL